MLRDVRSWPGAAIIESGATLLTVRVLMSMSGMERAFRIALSRQSVYWSRSPPPIAAQSSNYPKAVVSVAKTIQQEELRHQPDYFGTISAITDAKVRIPCSI
ncbi:hypothetical protein LP417_01575 [Polaromonas sp. P1-6]|nr:hypothetical protein LP417_01575 [Polaromonas sp. P1-6]